MKALTPRWQEHEILISLIYSLSPPPHPNVFILSPCEAAMEVSDQYHRVLLHVEDHRQIRATGNNKTIITQYFSLTFIYLTFLLVDF